MAQRDSPRSPWRTGQVGREAPSVTTGVVEIIALISDDSRRGRHFYTGLYVQNWPFYVETV